MDTRSVFHLDCYSIIPQCQFQCDKCLQEIKTVLEQKRGVEKFYTEGEAENMKFIVEHNSSKVAVENLMETFRRLPSFYDGLFVPELLDA